MVMGLQVLYPVQDEVKAEVIKADIVAVHGLNGDSKNTWTSRQTNAFWLKDFLPLDVPEARVMTLGYNAHATFGNTTADIIDHAKSLLSSLVDKREKDDELRRPIIFIGHSLGGIVIKQSLFQAIIERRYNSISDSTVGIVFLGTPHRGSPKAAYGKVLAALAATVLNKPSPRLVNALQANSEALMRLTTDFRFQLPKYQIFSFYEMKPMKKFSDLVVEKHSTLLEIDGEEQIPVNANHEGMCKFIERQDDVYEKIFKRVRRMMKEQDGAPRKNLCREDVIQKMCRGLLAVHTETTPVKQRRFVLYGLGGSGKTQACLKFAEDYRESDITASQGFLDISGVCGIDEDPKAVRQWLSNTQNSWLLIIENANDPSINVSSFFPTGNRGSILLTTRNPDCKIHSTVGSCELGQLTMDDAVTLLLRATGAEETADETSRKKAIPITKTLGFFALAIVQAGAYIRQGLCEIDEYCELYTRCRQRLLEYIPIQQSSEYKYSVYTTWEISLEAIEMMCTDTSRNAIDLLRTFCFFHYDGISEEIFQRAWSKRYEHGGLHQDITHMFYMQSREKMKDWDPVIIREAAVLLVSFSLIKIDETGRCMSMHPLAHAWARDRLSEELQGCFWVTTSSTLGAAISAKRDLIEYRFRQCLLPHIKSCISFCKDKSFLSCFSGKHRVGIAGTFAEVFSESGLSQEAMELTEKVLYAWQKILGSEHSSTLTSMNNLAVYYSNLGRRQEATELTEKVLEANQRILGSEHPNTLASMNNLANRYSDLGRSQEAMELAEKVFEARQRTLGSEHPDTLTSMNNLACYYSHLGRRQEATELAEKVLEANQTTLGSEHPDTLRSMNNLAIIKRGRAERIETRLYTSRSPSPRETTTRRARFKAWLKRF